MNNLQCLLILSALASLLVTGPNLAPAHSYAIIGSDYNDNKNTKDYKNSIHNDVNTESEKTNQHLGQDNLCYRDDDCEETNDGQLVEGKDNAASGFNDQGKNIQQQPQQQQQQQQQQPSGSTTTPSPQTLGNGTTPTPTPTPRTCEECFTTILNSTQIDNLFGVFGDDVGGTSEICFALSNPGISETGFRTGLADAGIPEAKIIDLVKCLKESGIVFLI
jgi:hypothetical protein